jgi:autotransporter-associated beta strand protein
VITANRTVEVDAPLSLSHILFDDDNNYTIAGPQAITISSTFNDPVIIRVRTVHGHGGHMISAPLVLDHDLGILQESNQPLTISGPLDNSAGHRISKSGAGTVVFTGSQTLGNDTVVQVSSGKAQYTLDAADAASVGTNVVAQISAPATLELAGTRSALSDGVDHANITNAGTLLISGQSQAVGNITGTGQTIIGPAAELTAGIMQQSRLTLFDIGPVPGGKVTLRPNSGTSVLKELVFGIGAPPEPPAAIPEPSTVAFAVAAIGVVLFLIRARQSQWVRHSRLPENHG